eukprot:gnl/Dysnectes_brevis/2557_a3076_1539.p1 GENE.gnl/Dysnectes_brevis/2557_a3076_1539~~gnl/Dysnectes_brevis/2557_a3076_1539.p1  ORF type:complete len:363 (+),score=87.50 gnl/Dysnectes_brevis/2557_a3076_1539:25-1113(+)
MSSEERIPGLLYEGSPLISNTSSLFVELYTLLNETDPSKRLEVLTEYFGSRCDHDRTKATVTKSTTKPITDEEEAKMRRYQSRRRRRKALAVGSIPSKDVSLPMHYHSEENTWRIISALRNCTITREFSVVVLRDLSSRMGVEHFSAGECIIRQGDRGKKVYVLLEGVCEVSKNDSPICDLTPCRAFGELAPMFGIQRAASVHAGTDVTVVSVDSKHLRAATELSRQKEISDLEHLVSTVPFFAGLDSKQRFMLAQAFQTDCCPSGALIVEQGTPGSKFFLLVSGQADIEINGKVIKALDAGSFFGEAALISFAPRNASVRAHGASDVAWLHRETFTALLGPAEHLIESKAIQRFGKTPDKS